MLDPEKSAYTQKSLYSRLGGYDVIAALIHDLTPRLRADPALAVYWKGVSDDSAQKGDQLTINFICASLEGPVHYSGRDMKTSHKGMGITEAEWEIFLSHVAAALDSVGIEAREKAEFLEITDSLKWDIVDVPNPDALVVAV